ncbi:hypothetical protein PVK06_047944 [Gossypium arboreum]|uniref:Uncharacterized protein n=1 Tax=Gossypium arboreum TaxID=29729 RepID=A0ABR0MEL6_GOSAR|nr:hypothetical protein PVK06_047944 [Gossypium arboreum]
MWIHCGSEIGEVLETLLTSTSLVSVDTGSEGKRSLPTSNSGNSELGIEALAELVRKVVEEVLETKVKEIRETLQAGCLECKKRKDSSSQKTEPHFVKHVKT